MKTMKTLNEITLDDLLGKIIECTYKKYIIIVQNGHATIKTKDNGKYRYSFCIRNQYNIGDIKNEVKDIINNLL